MSNITKPIGGSTDLVANEAHVRQHLKILTKRWSELDDPVQFEIRCLVRDTKVPTLKFFDPDQIDQAVKYVANQNTRNNVYVTINPIRIERQGKASSTADVLAAFLFLLMRMTPRVWKGYGRLPGLDQCSLSKPVQCLNRAVMHTGN